MLVGGRCGKRLFVPPLAAKDEAYWEPCSAIGWATLANKYDVPSFDMVPGRQRPQSQHKGYGASRREPCPLGITSTNCRASCHG
jgi:hypothetical protein